MKTQIILILTVLGLLAACKKQQQSIAIPEGTYSGRFIYRGKGIIYQYRQVPVTLTFSGQNYTSSGGANYYPAGGSGIYSANNRDSITFHDGNAWTANFDWNLILNGDYAYHYEGDSLVINKDITSLASYEYRIKKN